MAEDVIIVPNRKWKVKYDAGYFYCPYIPQSMIDAVRADVTTGHDTHQDDLDKEYDELQEAIDNFNPSDEDGDFSGDFGPVVTGDVEDDDKDDKAFDEAMKGV